VKDKPWTVTLLSAASVPFAAFLAVIAADTVRCNVYHAVVVAEFTVLIMLAAVVAAIVVAAVVLVLWPAPIDRRYVRRIFAVLAIAAAVASVSYWLRGSYDPAFCSIQF
jgi:hypothetical protein